MVSRRGSLHLFAERLRSDMEFALGLDLTTNFSKVMQKRDFSF